MYGSLINRMMENNDYTNGNVKVGTYVTEYLYTDRLAYQVTAVKDPKHFTMKNTNSGAKVDVVKRGNRYFKEIALSKSKFEEWARERHESLGMSVEDTYEYLVFMTHLTDNELKRLNEGKEIKKYSKKDITIGVNDPYFDPNF